MYAISSWVSMHHFTTLRLYNVLIFPVLLYGTDMVPYGDALKETGRLRPMQSPQNSENPLLPAHLKLKSAYTTIHRNESTSSNRPSMRSSS